MGFKLSSGSSVAIATDYEDEIKFTALSNAEEAVATATGHGLVAGDYIEITSGWEDLSGLILRIKEVTEDTFTLENFDTTDTDMYAEGAGTGSVKKVKSFQTIQQVLSLSSSGGERQYVAYSPLDSQYDYQIPSTFSAQNLSIDIGDDPTLDSYKTLKKWSSKRAKCALRVRFPDKSEGLYNGYMSLNETPSLDKSDVMKVTATYALSARVTRYE